MEFDRFEIVKKLVTCFNGGYINHCGEFIPHKKANASFILDTCKTELDVKCKLLEWCTRDAHCSMPYSTDHANRKLHTFFLNGLNEYLGTNFTEEDIEVIYTYLGNACNHSLTVEFVESGYNMDLFKKE